MRTMTRLAMATAFAGATLAFGIAPAGAATSTVTASNDGGVSISSAADCEALLRGYGYIVGDGVKSACRIGATGVIGQPVCFARLLNLGVASGHAAAACDVAQR